MRDWVVLDDRTHEHWLSWAIEARSFVAARPTRA
jgi:hypothetical protein